MPARRMRSAPKSSNEVVAYSPTRRWERRGWCKSLGRHAPAPGCATSASDDGSDPASAVFPRPDGCFYLDQMRARPDGGLLMITLGTADFTGTIVNAIHPTPNRSRPSLPPTKPHTSLTMPTGWRRCSPRKEGWLGRRRRATAAAAHPVPRPRSCAKQRDLRRSGYPVELAGSRSHWWTFRKEGTDSHDGGKFRYTGVRDRARHGCARCCATGPTGQHHLLIHPIFERMPHAVFKVSDRRTHRCRRLVARPT